MPHNAPRVGRRGWLARLPRHLPQTVGSAVRQPAGCCAPARRARPTRSRWESRRTSQARSPRPATPTGRWRSSPWSRSTPDGGIGGRPIELHLEDTASDPKIAVGNVRRLIQEHKVNVVLGGITSAMRQAIKDPIVNRGRTLYIYPQLYEGQECTKYLYLHRADPGAAGGRADPLSDQAERAEALRHAVGQLCVAAAAQPLHAQGDRGQRRRGGVRGVLPARPGGILRDNQQDHATARSIACSTRSSRLACSRS